MRRHFIALDLAIVCLSAGTAAHTQVPTGKIARIAFVHSTPSPLGNEKFRAVMTQKEGAPYEPAAAEKDLDAIRGTDPFEKIILGTTPDPNGGVDITYTFETDLHDIQIRGNRLIPTARILQVFMSKPGEPLDTKLLQQDISRLAQTNAFATIGGYEITPDDVGLVTVTIPVVEKPGLTAAEAQSFPAPTQPLPAMHGDGTSADALLSVARGRAASGHKGVLLIFGASWCGPCRVLEAVLSDPDVGPMLAAHYIVLHIDIFEQGKSGWENPGGQALYRKFGGTGAIPFCAVLDPMGTQMAASTASGRSLGMPGTSADVDAFIGMFRKSNSGLTGMDLARLRAVLERTVVN